RIKAVDFDGSVNYSPIRNLRLLQGYGWANVYPNPVGVNNSIHLKTNLEGQSQFLLYSVTGRLLRQTTFTGAAYLRLPNLAAGVYNYKIINASENITGQLIKQ
ncbi:MAG: T9SS type A sorting domain-containing protein, partial [Bacteroidota bacterium]